MHRFGFFHELDRIVIHPEYNANSIAYNVAVIKVTDPFVFENEVRIKIIPELYKENVFSCN